MLREKRCSNGMYGYVNKKGEWELDPIYLDASKFYEGKAAIVLNAKTHMYEIINTEGKKILSASYDKVEVINNHYFLVKLNKLYGVVDFEGRTIVAVDNDFIFKPNKDTFVVTCIKKSLYGVVNLKSENIPFVSNCVYDEMIEFYSNDNYIVASKGKKCGVIDRWERVIVPFEYSEIKIFKNVFCAKDLNKKWGVIDLNGEEMIPFKYEKIYLSGNDKIVAIRKEMDEYPIG